MTAIESTEQLLPQVRRDILRMVHQVNSGHPGGSLGCAEFFVSLYQHVMVYSTDFSMDGKNEDLFFLSNAMIYFIGIRLQQQCKISRNHQALNMVGICVLQAILNAGL